MWGYLEACFLKKVFKGFTSEQNWVSLHNSEHRGNQKTTPSPATVCSPCWRLTEDTEVSAAAPPDYRAASHLRLWDSSAPSTRFLFCITERHHPVFVINKDFFFFSQWCNLHSPTKPFMFTSFFIRPSGTRWDLQNITRLSGAVQLQVQTGSSVSASCRPSSRCTSSRCTWDGLKSRETVSTSWWR